MADSPSKSTTIDFSSNFIKLMFGFISISCVAAVTLLIKMNLTVNTILVDQKYMKVFIADNTAELENRSTFMKDTDMTLINVQNEILFLKKNIVDLELKYSQMQQNLNNLK